MKKIKYVYTISFLIFVIVIISYFLFSQLSPVAGKYDDFAQCLTEKGATVYGAYWCPHCLNQKNMFGSSWQYVNYVECDPKGANSNPRFCTEKGINGYPTWVINGRQYAGELSLENLARLSSCSLPK